MTDGRICQVIYKKECAIGTFSRRGAVASATIYHCAECASLQAGTTFLSVIFDIHILIHFYTGVYKEKPSFHSIQIAVYFGYYE